MGLWLLNHLATPFLQPVWDKMLVASLWAMNIGNGGIPQTSGERFVIEGLPQGATVFDVGANQGQYARMALAIRPDLNLYCFEPSANAFRELNRLPVNAFPIAFSNIIGSASLYADAAGSGLASLHNRPIAGFGEVGMVDLTTVDVFCEERGIEHIDLLKIDVEGHELSVLEGARDTAIDRIQFEFGGSAIDARIYLRDFFDALPDYMIYRVLPRDLYPVRYSERMEQFVTTNYLAIHHAPRK